MRRLLLSVLAIVLAAAVPAAAWTPVGTVQGYLIIANTLTDVQTVHLVDSVALFGGGYPVLTPVPGNPFETLMNSAGEDILVQITGFLPTVSGNQVTFPGGNGLNLRLRSQLSALNQTLGTAYQSGSYSQSGSLISFEAYYVNPDGRIFLPNNSGLDWMQNYGITNQLRLTGTADFGDVRYIDGYAPYFPFVPVTMTLSVQPIPEPVFFQVGTLAALSGLGLLRLRRRS